MRKPTKLQKATLEILRENPDKPLAQAMREAGYSYITSRRPKQNFVALKGTQIAMDQWREALRGSNLGEARLLRKLNEWIDAKKLKTSLTEPDREVPDYETQLKAGEMIRRDLGLPVGTQPVNVGVQVNVTPILGGVTKDVPENESAGEANQS